MAKAQLLDRWGNPVNKAALATAAPRLPELNGAGITGVRSPTAGYPGDGLHPERLAALLKAADRGDPVQFLELAETIEERDGHYLGVLGTRRRSVAQLDVTVEPASDASEDVDKADLVRAWLKRDELQDELFDILDAVGKGYSVTRIDWDVSEGQWSPAGLTREDPRWYRYARADLTTPVAIDEHGQEARIEPFRYIWAEMKAKSGLPLRSGLARVASWAWMFKAFSLRDWAIFSQTYGQPLRVGKYGNGASEADRETLFRAVANIAGDCAAIIPESMTIDFVETGNVGASSDLYERRADWLNREVSKAVLGQTTTTDAVSGGHAVSREHRLVQEDIERSDARGLSAVLNRDLVRSWIQLEYGPQKAYPRLVIARPEAEDLAQMTAAVKEFVPLGFRVSQKQLRDKYGFVEPKPDEEVLAPRPPAPTVPEAPSEDETDPSGQGSRFKRQRDEIKRGVGVPGTGQALHAEGASTGRSEAEAPEDVLAERLVDEAAPSMAGMLGKLEVMVSRASSLPELRQMLFAAYPDLDTGPLVERLAQAMVAGHAGGMAAAAEESDGQGSVRVGSGGPDPSEG